MIAEVDVLAAPRKCDGARCCDPTLIVAGQRSLRLWESEFTEEALEPNEFPCGIRDCNKFVCARRESHYLLSNALPGYWAASKSKYQARCGLAVRLGYPARFAVVSETSAHGTE